MFCCVEVKLLALTVWFPLEFDGKIQSKTSEPSDKILHYILPCSCEVTHL